MNEKLFISTKSITLNATFLSVLCLLSIGLHSQKASAKPVSRCEQIRQVRHLAREESLDGQNLARLESLHCSRNKDYEHHVPKSSEINFPSKNVSEDCTNLNLMTQLARVSEENNHLVNIIKKQQKIICLETSSKNSSLYHPNGRIAKLGSSFYYPNGRIAKLGLSFYYPNGKIAKLGSSFYYPNGKIAKLGSSLLLSY